MDRLPQDPWVETWTIQFHDPKTGTDLIFTTSSWGGKSASGGLLRAYGQHLRSHPDSKSFPVVELQTGTMRTKAWGDVPKPVFRIIGWTGNGPTDPLPGPATLSIASNAGKPDQLDDMSDSIPF